MDFGRERKRQRESESDDYFRFPLVRMLVYLEYGKRAGGMMQGCCIGSEMPVGKEAKG